MSFWADESARFFAEKRWKCPLCHKTKVSYSFYGGGPMVCGLCLKARQKAIDDRAVIERFRLVCVYIGLAVAANPRQMNEFIQSVLPFLRKTKS